MTGRLSATRGGYGTSPGPSRHRCTLLDGPLKFRFPSVLCGHSCPEGPARDSQAQHGPQPPCCPRPGALPGAWRGWRPLPEGRPARSITPSQCPAPRDSQVPSPSGFHQTSWKGTEAFRALTGTPAQGPPGPQTAGVGPAAPQSRGSVDSSRPSLCPQHWVLWVGHDLCPSPPSPSHPRIRCLQALGVSGPRSEGDGPCPVCGLLLTSEPTGWAAEPLVCLEAGMPDSQPWVVMCPEARGLQTGSPHQPGAGHGPQGAGDTALPSTGSRENRCLMWKVPAVSPCPHPRAGRRRPSTAGPPGTPPRACSPSSAEQAGTGLSCGPGGGGNSPLRVVSHTKHGSTSQRELTGTDSAIRELRAASQGLSSRGDMEDLGRERGDSTPGLCYEVGAPGRPGPA